MQCTRHCVYTHSEIVELAESLLALYMLAQFYDFQCYTYKVVYSSLCTKLGFTYIIRLINLTKLRIYAYTFLSSYNYCILTPCISYS